MEKTITRIFEQISIVESNFLGFSEAELLFKENSDKWSKKEILGHLVDSAQNNIRRIVVGQYLEKENIVYQQNSWIKAADYQHYNTTDLLQLFVLLNKHFCILLKNLPIEKHQTLTNWGTKEPNYVTLVYMSNDYLKHLVHHVNQILDKNYTRKFGEY